MLAGVRVRSPSFVFPAFGLVVTPLTRLYHHLLPVMIGFGDDGLSNLWGESCTPLIIVSHQNRFVGDTFELRKLLTLRPALGPTLFALIECAAFFSVSVCCLLPLLLQVPGCRSAPAQKGTVRIQAHKVRGALEPVSSRRSTSS